MEQQFRAGRYKIPHLQQYSIVVCHFKRYRNTIVKLDSSIIK